MNKQDLAQKLSDQFSVSKAEGERIVDFVFDSIKESVSEGDKVSIAGFGIFNKKISAPRVARNPKTGEKVDVPATSKVKFSAGKVFKEFLND